MQKPISRAEAAPVRVVSARNVPVRIVIVTMDSHLAQAAQAAGQILRRDLPGLELVVHAADEWSHDPALLDACHADIARGDIVIATMLFMDDHIQAVLPALQARREQCDAIVCCLSAGEIVRLTRLGRFNMSAEATGMMAMLKKLRGSRGKSNASSGRDQMAMLKRLPKLLRFIPGPAQDARAYFLCLQYWLAGSEINLVGMMRLLVDRYAAGPRQVLRGTLAAAPPVEYPDVGLYHPAARGQIVERLEQLPARGGENGTVGLLLMRSYVLAGNAAHYDGVIASLEARGLKVIPAFSSGLDSRPAIEAYFLRNGVTTIDTLLSLTGFSLVGGPAYNDAKAAEEILARLDVPYIAAHPAEFQTLQQWQQDPRGLLPVEAAMMVAIPELDGAIWPMTYGGRSSEAEEGQQRQMEVHPERASMLASRVARLAALRRSERADRRLAIVLFNFPPNAGATGTAAYLSVFESLQNTLQSLAAGGYTIDVPGDVDALRARVLEGNSKLLGTDANVAHRIPASEHVRRERWLADIERQWGPAPGRQLSDGSSIQILGAQLGNVFIGIQPSFGYEGDPMRMLFEHGSSPTHAMSAFYRYLREDFAADAVLHFGTHGALEFLPGKHAGMSGACWPDRLIGDMPNYYLYAANNPSEGALAKRRTGATMISYMTPPLGTAGLYRGLLDLKSSIDRWRGLEPDADADQRASLLSLLQAQSAAVDLAVAEPAWTMQDAAPRIDALRSDLHELEQTLIPHGLHVVGRPMDADARASMLDAAGLTDPERRASIDALLGQDHETGAILHALDARYLRPVVGGDFVRSPDMLPTGRNIHGLDPFRIPSAFAVQDGALQAERLLDRHRAEGHDLPETVAMVLWGTDNLKTEGGPLSQALWLMGAEPRHDSYGRLTGAQLVPLDRLGRARIDVVLTLSGIFRDLLPMQMRLLAEAAFLAASAEEAPEQNFIRKHVLAFIAEKGGSIEDAALRVFGNSEDAYGSNVNLLIGQGGWSDENELADVFVKRKGHAYGIDGRSRRQDALLSHILGKVDVAYQNLESVEVGVTTIDHYFDTLGGIGRAVQRARGTQAQIYIGDQTRGAGSVRTLGEQISLETRTRTLNPAWYEALLAHGSEGVRNLEAQVTNTLGWSATTGQVAPWVYRQMTETFVQEKEMRDRLSALNPTASAQIINRLIEASERNYWSPDAAMLDDLHQASEELEDRLEGITEVAA
ncbi:magnesium chelatase subunit H [Lichenicoccus roseus]|uniref:magnesium chelatase n=2 Tax=Lichenicoccus roseus TaxID=2683649 RepID=A0A5R9J918_9PROT|nr:magnesium chelatase subunit H [Lichenicoccus roseus]